MPPAAATGLPSPTLLLLFLVPMGVARTLVVAAGSSWGHQWKGWSTTGNTFGAEI